MTQQTETRILTALILVCNHKLLLTRICVSDIYRIIGYVVSCGGLYFVMRQNQRPDHTVVQQDDHLTTPHDLKIVSPIASVELNGLLENKTLDYHA